MSDSDELKQMTERAMAAEARVAELLEEQSRIGGSKPLSGSLSPSSGDSKLRQRAETAEAEREDLRAQKRKLERSLEEKEQALQKALKDPEGGKEYQQKIERLEEEHKQQIARLEEELKQARDAASAPPPEPDTSQFLGQLKSKDEELARLSDEIRDKGARIGEMAGKLEALTRVEEERDGLGRELEELRAQVEKAKAQNEQDASGVVEHLKAELEEMAKKQAASADTARRLTRENQQLLEKLAAMKREQDELIKKAESMRDEIAIVSVPRKDGTQPETPTPPRDMPTWPSTDRVEVVPESTPPKEESPEDLPEDMLPELEPMPLAAAPLEPAPLPPVVEPAPARRPSKGGWFLRVFLFLVLAGAAFLAARHFLPMLLDSPAAGPETADVIVPADTQPEPRPAPADEILKSPEEQPEEAPEEPVEKVVKKKTRAEKKKPKKTAIAREPEMTAREAKKQARRLISNKQHDEAQKLLADWVKKRPKDADLRYLYGRLQLLRGKKDAAVEQLEEAIELDPKKAEAYHDLGAIYLQLGETELACETLGHFVRLKPSHPRTQTILGLLKKMKCP